MARYYSGKLALQPAETWLSSLQHALSDLLSRASWASQSGTRPAGSLSPGGKARCIDRSMSQASHTRVSSPQNQPDTHPTQAEEPQWQLRVLLLPSSSCRVIGMSCSQLLFVARIEKDLFRRCPWMPRTPPCRTELGLGCDTCRTGQVAAS